MIVADKQFGELFLASPLSAFSSHSLLLLAGGWRPFLGGALKVSRLGECACPV